MKAYHCDSCGGYVDTEIDPLALDEDEFCLCFSCREEAELQQAENERLDDPRHGQAAELNK